MLNAYVNHAPGAAVIQVFTFAQTTLPSTEQTVEVPYAIAPTHRLPGRPPPRCRPDARA
jgi:hypothetical protein